MKRIVLLFISIIFLLCLMTGCIFVDKKNENVETYKIVFRQDGLDDISFDIEVGKTFDVSKKPAVQEKEGYEGSWDDSNINYETLNENKVIFAKYIPNSYTVTYSGEGTFSKETDTFVFDQDYELIEPTMEGYFFVCWLDGNNTIAQSGKWKIAANVVLTSKWENEPAVIFIQDGMEPIKYSVEKGQDFIGEYPAINPIEGYEVKWEEKDLTNITEIIKVNIVKTPKEYTVYYQGEGTFERTSDKVIYDSSYELLQPTRKGYTFISWKLNDKAISSTGLWKIAEDVTLIAEWQLNNTSYSIIYTYKGVGTVPTPYDQITMPSNQTVKFGDRIQLSAATSAYEADYGFAGWKIIGTDVEIRPKKDNKGNIIGWDVTGDDKEVEFDGVYLIFSFEEDLTLEGIWRRQWTPNY